MSLVIDAADPAALAAFWSGQLDWPIVHSDPDEVDVLAPESDGCGVELVFVPVPDAKTGPNRIHLDLRSGSDDDQAALVARAHGLGGTTIDIGQRRVPWVVLADPEGNELCVREPSRHYTDTGAIAAILVDAADPSGLADFWVQATGWERHDNAEGCVSLRAPGGRGPWLEFWPQLEEKAGKNRLHLDVAPPADGTVAVEVDRLAELGAETVDIGQGDVSWTVLVDPEGNEFCILSPR